MMNDVLNCTLPYPYKQYTDKEKILTKEFDEYKKIVYGWVKNNTAKCVNIPTKIDQMFSLIHYSSENEDIKEWLKKHSDKIKYIYDFSGLDFGINIDLEYECVELICPLSIHTKGILYPDYDPEKFMCMDIIQQLEWMYEHCEFIPIRELSEEIDIFGHTSHKFSHIKREPWIMNLLCGYLSNVRYPPNDNDFYFIKFNYTKNMYYLKKDLKKL